MKHTLLLLLLTLSSLISFAQYEHMPWGHYPTKTQVTLKSDLVYGKTLNDYIEILTVEEGKEFNQDNNLIGETYLLGDVTIHFYDENAENHLGESKYKGESILYAKLDAGTYKFVVHSEPYPVDYQTHPLSKSFTPNPYTQYDYFYESFCEFEITIEKKELRPEAYNAASKFYDGLTTVSSDVFQNIDFGFKTNYTRISGDDVKVVVDAQKTLLPSADAGIYEFEAVVKLEGATSNNYFVGQNPEITIIVKKINEAPEFNIEPHVQYEYYELTYGKSLLGTDFYFTNLGISKDEGDFLIDGVSQKGNVLDPGTYIFSTPKIDSKNITVLPVYDRTIFVDRKTLQVVDAQVEKQKLFDGTDEVAVISEPEIKNLEEGDEVILTLKEVKYKDKNIGKDKIIIAVYQLSGKDYKKYKFPENYIQEGDLVTFTLCTDGEIFGPEIKAKISQEDNHFCAGENCEFMVTLLEGLPFAYDVVFDEDAIKQGFENFENQEFSNSKVTFEIPKKAQYGTYKGSIFLNGTNCQSKALEFEIIVDVTSDVIISKFNEVVLIDNHEDIWKEFQWYKSNDLSNKQTVKIEGANYQFYEESDYFFENQNILYGWYNAVLTNQEGQEFTTCKVKYDFTNQISKSKESSIIKVYPNPAKANSTINIELENNENSVIKIFNISGNLVEKIVDPQINNSIWLNKGEYSIILEQNNQKSTSKIIVR